MRKKKLTEDQKKQAEADRLWDAAELMRLSGIDTEKISIAKYMQAEPRFADLVDEEAAEAERQARDLRD